MKPKSGGVCRSEPDLSAPPSVQVPPARVMPEQVTAKPVMPEPVMAARIKPQRRERGMAESEHSDQIMTEPSVPEPLVPEQLVPARSRLDAAPPGPPDPRQIPPSSEPMQRAVGELRVVAKRSGAETVLDDLRQVASLKARFPRRLVSGWMDVVTLNTSGGIAGGDRLDLMFEAGPAAQLTIAAQAAERFYRARPADPPSRVRTRLVVARGAALEWLPQETILFDRCAVDRRLDIDLADNACFLGVETLVFGRIAMREHVRGLWLRDLIRVRREDRLLLHDAIRLDGDVETLLRRPAIGNGAGALATLVHVAPDAEARLAAVRQSLPSVTPSTEAAASAWNGMLLVRILAVDGAAARQAVRGALSVLRGSRPLPRVWLC